MTARAGEQNSAPFERAQHEAADYVRWFVEHASAYEPRHARVPQTFRQGGAWRIGASRSQGQSKESARPYFSCLRASTV